MSGVQILLTIVGLGFGAMVLYAAHYMGGELERTALRPLGRFLRAIVGGLLWGLVGVVVALGLFVLAVVIHALFFRPVFSIIILQFWAVRAGAVVVLLYILWGFYHGAKNRLEESYRFRREPREVLDLGDDPV